MMRDSGDLIAFASFSPPGACFLELRPLVVDRVNRGIDFNGFFHAFPNFGLTVAQLPNFNLFNRGRITMGIGPEGPGLKPSAGET